MKLKTLLQSICFCDTCGWCITRIRYYLFIYPSKDHNLNYMFNEYGRYVGNTTIKSLDEKTLSKEHIKFIINNGLSNYIDTYPF